MPAIYTFSLDLVRDRDIIELLESRKNRSDYIRTLLRKEQLTEFYMDLFDDVHARYNTATFMHRGTPGDSKADFIARRKRINKANSIAKQQEE